MRPIGRGAPAGFKPGSWRPWRQTWDHGLSTSGAGWWSPYFSSSAYAPLYYPDDYLGGFGYAYREPPTVVIVMTQTAAPEPPPPPPSPARPQTREYDWPDPGNGSPSTLAIVLKDGTVKTAVATCVQDGFLTYITQDGDSGRVEIGALDREATRSVNAGLRL
jgi:hypothetical protein